MNLRQIICAMLHRGRYSQTAAISRTRQEDVARRQQEVAKKLAALGLEVQTIRRERGSSEH